jgi:hypothetical protein
MPRQGGRRFPGFDRLGWRNRNLNGELILTGDRLLIANVPEAPRLRVARSPFKLDDRRFIVTGEVVVPRRASPPARGEAARVG